MKLRNIYATSCYQGETDEDVLVTADTITCRDIWVNQYPNGKVTLKKVEGENSFDMLIGGNLLVTNGVNFTKTVENMTMSENKGPNSGSLSEEDYWDEVDRQEDNLKDDEKKDKQ